MEGITMGKYSKEFKEEALKLSDEIGVKNAANQLGIAYYTLADWRSIRRNRPPTK
ncbi:transposase, partial [Dysosmobacter sp. HCP28S3_G4]|uniref:transposase n=1 Tax=Dysosmobacter sp. HCP28S3_G4 TaxID=3438938 RepID=UPI003F8C5D96